MPRWLGRLVNILNRRVLSVYLRLTESRKFKIARKVKAMADVHVMIILAQEFIFLNLI